MTDSLLSSLDFKKKQLHKQISCNMTYLYFLMSPAYFIFNLVIKYSLHYLWYKSELFETVRRRVHSCCLPALPRATPPVFLMSLNSKTVFKRYNFVDEV